jgi:hypothetical protein
VGEKAGGGKILVVVVKAISRIAYNKQKEIQN